MNALHGALLFATLAQLAQPPIIAEPTSPAQIIPADPLQSTSPVQRPATVVTSPEQADSSATTTTIEEIPRLEVPSPDQGQTDAATSPRSEPSGRQADPSPSPSPSGAKALVSRLFEQTAPSEFRATPVSFVQLFDSPFVRPRAVTAVRAYWQLVAAICEYGCAQEELAMLGPVLAGGQNRVDADFQAEAAVAAARLESARSAITSAQYALLEQLGSWDGDSLPWPADMPVVVPYETRFRELFQGQTPPFALRRLNDLLPQLQTTLEVQAEACEKSRQAATEIAARYRAGNASSSDVIRALERWRSQARSFLATVQDYNDSIAEYAVAVVGPTADSATLAATMVGRQSQSTAATRPSDVAPATALVPLTERETMESPAPAPGRTETNEEPREPAPFPQSQSVLRRIRVAH